MSEEPFVWTKIPAAFVLDAKTKRLRVELQDLGVEVEVPPALVLDPSAPMLVFTDERRYVLEGEGLDASPSGVAADVVERGKSGVARRYFADLY